MCPYLHSFGRAAHSPAPAAILICPARPVLYRGRPVQRVQLLGGRSALALARPGSGAACDVQPVRVRWGLGLHRRGIWGEPGGGVVDTSRRKNSKKAFSGGCAANTHPTFTKRHPSDCAILQIFRKIQKDPFRSLDCGIIS